MTADITKHGNDPDRTTISLDSANNRYNVTARFRLKTDTDIPVTLPLAGQCGLKIDSTQGNSPDIMVTFHDSIVDGSPNGPTVVSDVVVSGLESDDYEFAGGFACALLTPQAFDITSVIQQTVTPWISKSAVICGAVAPYYFQACPVE
jgi:hypothetical protein